MRGRIGEHMKERGYVTGREMPLVYRRVAARSRKLEIEDELEYDDHGCPEGAFAAEPFAVARALVESLAARPTDGRYLFDGRVARDASEYRAHLLRLIARHPRLTEETKAEIKQSELGRVMRGVVEELFGADGLPTEPAIEVF